MKKEKQNKKIKIMKKNLVGIFLTFIFLFSILNILAVGEIEYYDFFTNSTLSNNWFVYNVSFEGTSNKIIIYEMKNNYYNIEIIRHNNSYNDYSIVVMRYNRSIHNDNYNRKIYFCFNNSFKNNYFHSNPYFGGKFFIDVNNGNIYSSDSEAFNSNRLGITLYENNLSVSNPYKEKQNKFNCYFLKTNKENSKIYFYYLNNSLINEYNFNSSHRFLEYRTAIGYGAGSHNSSSYSLSNFRIFNFYSIILKNISNNEINITDINFNPIVSMKFDDNIDNESYNITLKYNPYLFNVTTYLNINNLRYVMNKNSLNSNEFLYSISLNKSLFRNYNYNIFNFTFSIYNLTHTFNVTSDNFNQTNLNLDINFCNPSLNYTFRNIYFFDLENLNNLTNVSLTSFFQNFSGSYNYNYEKNINESRMCVVNTLAYNYLEGMFEKINKKIKFKLEKDGYAPIDYYFFEIEKNKPYISLYSLSTSLLTPYTIKVLDKNKIPLSNYYLFVYLCNLEDDINNCYLTQSYRLDENGKTIAVLRNYNYDYVFRVYSPSGILNYTSSKMKIFPTSEYLIEIIASEEEESLFISFKNLTDLNYDFYYNSSFLYLNYYDSNSSFSNIYLVVYDAINTSRIIINITNNLSSYNYIFNLTNNQTGLYNADFYINRSNNLYLVKKIVFELKEEIFGKTNYIIFIGFLFIIIFSFIFLYNKYLLIIFLNIGIIMLNYFRIIDIGIGGITAFIVLSLIIIIALNRNENYI